MTADQERLDMRSGCHAEKILPVGDRGAKNVWCLSSLLFRHVREVMEGNRDCQDNRHAE